MTVSSAIATATFNWTGVETTFTPGFQALNPTDVSVGYTSAGVLTWMTYGTNYTVSLDASNNVTVDVVSFPPAPLSIVINRNSSQLQEDHFQDGVPWSAETIEGALDLLTMREQENKRDIQSVTAGLAAETTRAEAAEATNASAIAAESTRAETAEAANTAAIAAERTRAEAAEAALASGLTSPVGTLLATWLLGLPMQPQDTVGWWNNGGVPCYS